MNEQLIEAAINVGLPAFPCLASKSPATDRGFKDASADPARISELFSRYGAALIGVPTGEVSGISVIDVDPRHGGLAWLETARDLLPETRVHRTQGGGYHLLFRHPVGAGLRNSASRIAPGVDVRAEGGYVCWPSPGSGYEIEHEVDPADMPDWLIEAAVKPEPAPRAIVPYVERQALPGDITPRGRVALDNECRAIEMARDGQKHATLNKAAYSIGGLVTAGDLPECEAFGALSAALATILPYCQDQRAAEKTLRRAFDDGKGKGREVSNIPAQRGMEPIELHPARGFIDKINQRSAKARSKPLPVTPGMMDVQGALKLFVDHCQETAISPQPLLALAAGICVVGVLAGRRYRTRTNLRTNVYAVGIADSGGGKDHARQKVKAALVRANLSHYLGGEDIASGSAMLTALSRHPATLFQIDEFGDWFGGLLGKNAPQHKKAISERLKSLYSSAGSFVSGTEYADQSKDKGREKQDIHQPHACLYGTTTPGQFWSAVAGASLHDGLMARMMVFVSPENYPEEQSPDHVDPPEELIGALQAIAAGYGAPQARKGDGNLPALHTAHMAAKDHCEAYCVPTTPGADAAIEQMRLTQRQAKIANENQWSSSIAARLAENAIKLALIRAVSRNPSDPKMDASDIAWGRLMSEHCAETLLREAGRNVGDSEWERNINKCLDVVRRFGPISEGDFRRRGWNAKERDRQEVLRELIGTGEIVGTHKPSGPKGGKPTNIYTIGQEVSRTINVDADTGIDD